MRHLALMIVLVLSFATIAASSRATELAIPPPRSSAAVSMQKGPPNCTQWTDACVNCTRGADGDAPICSNIGVACQPKAIRCITAEPASGPSKK